MRVTLKPTTSWAMTLSIFVVMLLPTLTSADGVALYKQISKSVVVIFVPNGQGSGVLLSPTIVATNCHVVESHSQITVEFFGQKKSATIVGRNDAHDVCIVEIVSPFAESVPVKGARRIEHIEVGESIYAIGAPIGLKYTITSGIVSQLRAREGGTVVQFDAAISSGNSGGGLFDVNGNLLGLPSFSRERSPMTSGGVTQNLNFAWSVDVFPAPASKLIAAMQSSAAGAKGPAPRPAVANAGTSAAVPVREPSTTGYFSRWRGYFERQDYQQAHATANEWIRSQSLSPEAWVARGRASEGLKPGSGFNDFVSALRLNHSNPTATYFAAISAYSAGDLVYFERYKNSLKTLNPQLASQLP